MQMTETLPWDVADHLNTAEDIALYLEAAFEEGDPALVAAALGDVVRSRGMVNLARDAGVSHRALFADLNENGDPRLSTLLGALRALGMQISVKPAAAA